MKEYTLILNLENSMLAYLKELGVEKNDGNWMVEVDRQCSDEDNIIVPKLLYVTDPISQADKERYNIKCFFDLDEIERSTHNIFDECTHDINLILFGATVNDLHVRTPSEEINYDIEWVVLDPTKNVLV
jgi:hypothetical protein